MLVEHRIPLRSTCGAVAPPMQVEPGDWAGMSNSRLPNDYLAGGRDEVSVPDIRRREEDGDHVEERIGRLHGRILRLYGRDPEERPVPGRGGAPARSHSHDRADPQRQGVDDGRSIRRDQGAAGRVLLHRSEGPERRHPGGLEDPVGPHGQRRGAARHGPSISHSGSLAIRERGRSPTSPRGGRCCLPRRLAPRPRHA